MSLNEQFINLAQSIKIAKIFSILVEEYFTFGIRRSIKTQRIKLYTSEGFAAGEMKHGPIALIEEGLPIIMFLTSDGIEEKSISNLQEALARGEVFLISDQKNINKISLSKIKF